MRRWSHNIWLAVPLLLGALLFAPPGCKCNSEPEEKAEEESPTAALPDDYPMAARETAPALANRLPTDVDSVVFVSSFAAVVDVIEQMKSWRLVDPEQVAGIFSSLERYHGINPGSARSWRDNGFPLTDGFAIGLIGGKSFFVVTPVEDQEAFENFVDVFINQEFGRPRTHEMKHEGVQLTRINVLKRDLGTIAYRDGFAYLVAGERLIEEAPPSEEVMKRLLDVTPADSLGETEMFNEMLDELAEGPVFAFTLKSDVASMFLTPLTGGKKDEEDEKNPRKKEEVSIGVKAQRALSEFILDGVDGMGVGLVLDDGRLRIRSRIGLKEAQRETLLANATPDPVEATGLYRFLADDVTGLARITFSPENVEERVTGLLSKKAQKTWKKIKSSASVRLLLDFEDEVLYNLSGHALLTLFAFDQEAGSGSTEDLLEATDAALFLTFKDPAKSNAYFGKINLLKDLVPKKIVSFDERDDGVLVAVIKQKRQELFRVAYHDGVLALILGKADVDRVIEEMKASPSAGSAPGGITGELMQNGAVWGASVDMNQIVSFLSARYEIVQVQIDRFLTPLQRASVIVNVDEGGLAVDIEIEMRAGG